MSTLSACPGVVRRITPPALPRAVSSRATGTGTTSRSITLMALEDNAEMTARLRARAARDTSRDVVTVEPLRSVVAHAPASRTTSSGVISTLTMPGHAARSEQRALAPRLEDDVGVDDRTGLHGLEGVDLDVGRDHGLLTDDALVADDRALLDPRRAHDVGVLADHAGTQVGLRADEDVVVHDRPMQEGAVLHDHVAAEDAELPQLRAGLDLRVVADVQRATQHRLGVHVGALPHPDSGRDLERVEVDVDLAGQHVGLRPEVGLVGADVLPIALGDVAVDGQPLLHELREHVPRPVDGSHPLATWSKTSGSMT